jgi:hypothetical protein
MIGALVGKKNIPEEYIDKILRFDTDGDDGHKRPEFLSVKHRSLKSI